MQCADLIRRFVAIGFGLAILLCTHVSSARADDKEGKVTFKTVDGVDLHGHFYKPEKANDKPCVLLLHDFSRQKGGDSHQDDMDELADKLQKKGYPVLSFDFRGHGDSKNVAPDQFWTVRNNVMALPKSGFDPKSPPSSIDQKNFQPAYYLHLIDDINAAKAFLDRRSLAKEVNSSNVVVIGAGQGATLGMMWVYQEYRLVRQKGSIGVRPDFDEPEGRDINACIWLSATPEIEGVRIPIPTYLTDLERKHRVPMVFVYGKEDKSAETQALAWIRSVAPNYKEMAETGLFNESVKDLKYTRDLAIPETKLSGGKLLTKDLPTADNVIKYLDKFGEATSLRDARRVEIDKFPYYWIPPQGVAGQPIVAKVIQEEAIKPVNMRIIHLGSN